MTTSKTAAATQPAVQSELTRTLGEYIKAAFSAIWINTFEPNEVMIELRDICVQKGYQLLKWDIDQGMQSVLTNEGNPTANDPLAAVRCIRSMSDGEQLNIVVLDNFHRFISSTEVMQALCTQIHWGKSNNAVCIVLSPLMQLPVELEKLFVVVQHGLPTRDQLLSIAQGLTGDPKDLPADPQDVAKVIDAASGLTCLEAENAFSLSIVRDRQITPRTVWEMKTQTLQKSGLLTLYRGGGNFGDLGGMAALKDFTKRSLAQPSRGDKLRLAKGVLLLSPPGCGKSAFCKALGDEVGRPVLTLDVGSLMGSLVGQTEQRTRQALQIIDSMGECIVLVDEIEKAFAGVGGNGDSGVATRMFGTFLTWLNDRESDSYVVATCNDAAQLPPEFSRSERFDGVFFMDLPDRQEKDAIWKIYRQMYQIPAEHALPEDTAWTGAEIKACCRLATMLGLTLMQSYLNIVPVAVTSCEKVENLRLWATDRCLSASTPGIFVAPTKRKSQPQQQETRRRYVDRDQTSE